VRKAGIELMHRMRKCQFGLTVMRLDAINPPAV
jgi:hypothetical protein